MATLGAFFFATPATSVSSYPVHIKQCVGLGKHCTNTSVALFGAQPGQGWETSVENFTACNLRKWSFGTDWHKAAAAYPSVRSMKRQGIFLLPLVWMLVHRRSLTRNLLGFPNNINSLITIYTPGWRETLRMSSAKKTTLCPWRELEPRLLDPGTSAPTLRPPHLH